MERNTELLEGLACPECGGLGPFWIGMEATYKVSDEGYLDHEPGVWRDGSHCACEACGHSSTVAGFTAPPRSFKFELGQSPSDYQWWSESRNTSNEVAMMIWAMAEDADGAQSLWESPSDEQVLTVMAGAWTLTEDDELCWGEETLRRDAFDAAVEASGLGIEAVKPDLFYISTSDGDTYGPYHRESEAQNIIDDIMAVDDRFEADVDTGAKVLSDIINPRRFVLNTPIELKRLDPEDVRSIISQVLAGLPYAMAYAIAVKAKWYKTQIVDEFGAVTLEVKND